MGEAPAEIMREAYDAEVALWRSYTNYPKCTRFWALREVAGNTGRVAFSATNSEDAQIEFEAVRSEAGHRAALRAFAEMEPTDGMRDTAHASLDKTPIKDCEQQALKAWRLITLSAAEAGEDKPEGK